MRSGLPPTRQKNWQPQLSKNVIQKQPWPPSRARPTPRGKTKAQGNRQRLVALGAEVIGIGQSSSSCKHNPEALPGFPWGYTATRSLERLQVGPKFCRASPGRSNLRSRSRQGLMGASTSARSSPSKTTWRCFQCRSRLLGQAVQHHRVRPLAAGNGEGPLALSRSPRPRNRRSAAPSRVDARQVVNNTTIFSGRQQICSTNVVSDAGPLRVQSGRPIAGPSLAGRSFVTLLFRPGIRKALACCNPSSAFQGCYFRFNSSLLSAPKPRAVLDGSGSSENFSRL